MIRQRTRDDIEQYGTECFVRGFLVGEAFVVGVLAALWLLSWIWG